MVFFTGDFLYPLWLLLLSLDDLFRTLATPLGLGSARLHVGEAQGRQAGAGHLHQPLHRQIGPVRPRVQRTSSMSIERLRLEELAPRVTVIPFRQVA